MEQQYSSELMRYKAEFEKKIQNEIGELEAEKQEKLARINELDEMIGGFANRIDYNGPADISNLQAIYENRLVELNETLTKKVITTIEKTKFYLNPIESRTEDIDIKEIPFIDRGDIFEREGGIVKEGV